MVNFLIIPREWLYNTLYLMFAKTLVEFHKYKPKWDRILNILIVIFVVVLVLSMIIAKLTGYYALVGMVFAYFFSPTIAIAALISFYVLSKMDTKLKYYVITGSLIYLVLAESAFYLFTDVNKATVFFYTGIIIENMFFALALGQKQKLILEAKNKSQNTLINQLKENEKLKINIQEQLEKNVEVLSKQAEEEKIKAKYAKELAELKMTSLRSQMNPHFIFNSLNSIKLYIINNEKQNAVYYLNKFSKLIRKILATTQEKEITLSEEIETMELYLKIENIRFNNAIQFHVDIEKGVNINTIKIPCLMLQPFLENAIWHGLSLKKGDKKLDLLIKNDTPSFIQIIVNDNGIGRSKSQEINKQKTHKKKSIGIKLTQERLNHFFKNYQNNCSVTFTDLLDKNDDSKGTSVIIKIPLI